MSFKEKYGQWALITGASSGLGVEFADQLAKKGLNLILVARREELMKELAEKIQSQYAVEVKILAIDLSKEGFYAELSEKTADLDIGLIVNNAGMNSEGHFYRADLARNIQMIRLNMEAPFIIAYEMGKKFIEKGRGGIIFTASSSSFQATPYLSHYGATKAYLLSLAESMNYEFKDKGVDVIALCPGMTESEMTKSMKGSPLVMKAAPVVKSAIDNLGKQAYIVTGLGNKIQAFMTQRVLGRDLSRNIAGSLMKRVLPGARKK
ncbi:MAG TPA: SDR family NAD(P)-dependent oxidoreductase [Chitinophagales bacterium]|nr:SDR family NAD(P)-dependent oxidoreductase [Chitinophagales bacterium]